MKFIKLFSYVLASILLLGAISIKPVLADTDLENADLARIINVLNSISPLIDEAEHQQDKTARVEFQYDALRADLNKIKSGIAQKLQTSTIEPREVLPIDGDYLHKRNKHL